MLKLQRFLRRMKELSTYCKNVHFDEKSRRILIIAIAAVVSVYFITLPWGDGNPVHAQAAVVSGHELFEEILSNADVFKKAAAEEIGETTERTQADSNYLNIPQLRLAAAVAGEFEKVQVAEDEDDLLEIFGERDGLFEEDVLTDETQFEKDMSAEPEAVAAGNIEALEAVKNTDSAAVNAAAPMLTEEEAFYASVDLEDIPSGLTLSYNSAYRMKLSAEQLKVLETIVEAEAGDEDAYGKILVANVVLNRVLDDEFPDTIKEVVFQNNGKTYQFSPVRSGGRYYTVTVSEHTKAAVARALNGEDYSDGALYFFARRYTSSSKAKWFDTALRKITEYGCHEFFGNK